MKLGEAMQLAGWVRAAREKAAFTQERLGEVMGVTKANISAWENGRHEPSYDQLVKISSATGQSLPFIPNASAAPDTSRRVPLIDRIHAGSWEAVIEGRSVDDPYDMIPINGQWSRSTFAMRIEGDSMTPDYRENDIIVVDPEAPPRPGCMVVAVNTSGEAIFRQFKRHRTDEQGRRIFKLVPLNDAYETTISDEHPMRIIGSVVEHHRFPYSPPKESQ